MNKLNLKSLIGVAGRMGAGKDTFSDILTRNHGYRKFALAAHLKNKAMEDFDLTIEQVSGDQKDVVDPRYNVTPRYIMQTMGTEWYRSIDNNFWIKKLHRQIEIITGVGMGHKVVISDIRYPNEAKWIHDNGGILIWVDRPGLLMPENGGTMAEARKHSSENSFTKNDSDYSIVNDGTVEDLQREVNYFINTVLALRED